MKKKRQAFRNNIRRQEIEQYKRSKRKQLLNQDFCEQQYQNTEEIQNIYRKILQNTKHQNLCSMQTQTFHHHLQMLVEIIFSQSTHKFVNLYEEILSIIIDYFLFGVNKCKEEGELILQNSNHEFQINQYQEHIKVYAMTKMIHYFPSNFLFKIIGGIYYESFPKNLNLTKAVVDLLMQLLSISLKDHSIFKEQLNQFGNASSQFNLNINKQIRKQFILIALLNLSSSENDQIIQILTEKNVLQKISMYLQTYGFTEQQKQPIAGIYSNSIQFLCNNLDRLSQVTYYSQQEENQEFIQQNIKDHYLYLNLFRELVEIQNIQIISNMVVVAIHLLKTAKKYNFSCLKQIIQICDNFVYVILQLNRFFQRLDELFVELSLVVSSNNYLRLFDLLDLIINHYTTVIYRENEKFDKSRLGETYRKSNKITKLKQIISSSQLILTQCLEDKQQLRQNLVCHIMNFWMKEQLIIGSEQLLSFILTALKINRDLFRFIVLQKYQDQILDLIKAQYEKHDEISFVLTIIKVIIEGLLNRSDFNYQKYKRRHIDQWFIIRQRIQGYIQIHGIQNNSIVSDAIQIQKILDKYFHQIEEL